MIEPLVGKVKTVLSTGGFTVIIPYIYNVVSNGPYIILVYYINDL